MLTNLSSVRTAFLTLPPRTYFSELITPRCTQTLSMCPPGANHVNGQCCMEKADSFCFPSFDGCPSDCTLADKVCAPSKLYDDVFSHVSIEAVANPSPKVREHPGRCEQGSVAGAEQA